MVIFGLETEHRLSEKQVEIDYRILKNPIRNKVSQFECSQLNCDVENTIFYFFENMFMVPPHYGFIKKKNVVILRVFAIHYLRTLSS